MVLLRQLLGDVLRRLRIRQGRTLREVSASARVSLGYLSEVERGRKEASSELLAAICAALETPLSQVFREVSDNFALAELQQDTVLSAPREPSLLEPGLRGPGLREQGLRQAGLRIAADRVPVPAETPDAATADLDDVPAIDVSSVGDGFADRRGGFAGHGGQVRDVTDMVPV
jgi:transcriptional regulator with XRE-family HTH domain